jgi:hypothetical protein
MAADSRPNYVIKSVLNFTHDDVINGRVVYRPLSSPTGYTSSELLSDVFTFVLTARRAQPVTDNVSMQIVPPFYHTAPGPHDNRMSMKSTTIATIVDAYAPSTLNPASGKSVGGGTSSFQVGKDNVVIVAVVAVLTAIAVVGLIVFKCIRRRRDAKRRNYELAAAIDASTAAAAVASSGSGSDELAAPRSTGDNNTTRPRPGSTSPTVLQPPIIIEPPPIDSEDDDGDSRDSGPTPSVRRQQGSAVIPNVPTSAADAAPEQDATSSRAGYIRIVTPSPPAGVQGPPVLPPSRPGPPPLQRNGAVPPTVTMSGSPGTVGGRQPLAGSCNSVWKEQVTFDWEHVDPELLQHCRKTNPVLHKNQYWV